MTNRETVAEQRNATAERRAMKWPEKIVRGIGGYVLGFTGLAFEAGGIATINPLLAGAGAGLVYAGHRVIEPMHDIGYGNHAEIPKWRRAARFNASLIPTYIGASLLGSAIFGAESTAGVALTAGERVASGAIGVPVLVLGSAYERHLHTGGAAFPGLDRPEATTPAADPATQSTGILQSARNVFREGYARARGRQVAPTA